MINELDLLSVPNFTALGIFFFFMCVCVWGGRGGGGRLRRLILVLMSNVCYLAEILIYVVVTVRYLVITSVYCSLLVVVTSGYCPLLVVTACYWWLLLVTSGYCSLPLVTARSHFQYERVLLQSKECLQGTCIAKCSLKIYPIFNLFNFVQRSIVV